jgi:hypothetical protein
VANKIARFRVGQRVQVRIAGDGDDGIQIVPTTGTVRRLRFKDNGAWIELDGRSATPGVHPFGVGDPRENHVLAFPQDCEAE